MGITQRLYSDMNSLSFHTGMFPTVEKLDQRKPVYQKEWERRLVPSRNLDQIDVDAFTEICT